ncbi:DUF3488 and transglutaminase-like domain-containing protein [Actinacidiphila oryziradicis]|uniref:transglutaminase TgpA family protein n=1 Tax=Actinacidiphila oryziradicis TaxID=2571141 RepID=UPI0023F2D495|nr:DUF3488 and transglutaminase-like domain-containing protein [Actinacidiphila oryziradicis]MCW2872107.1 Transglutaminase protein [Actinacidiphila oryziradicis]
MLSGRARLAVCAAAASVMAACSLLPLVTPTGWILEAVLLVAVQTSVGALTRRAPLPRPVTVLVQTAVSLLLLTLLFARNQALLGLLPGPKVFEHFGQLLNAGGQDVSQYAIPAPVTEGIRLLLVGGVVVVALVVDALAVTYGQAAPAGLPLLALYSVAAGLDVGGSRWLYFVIAASGYLLLLLAEGQDRLSRWGRVFGGSGGSAGAAQSGYRGSGGQSGLPPHGGAVAPVRTGRRIGAMALGIALVAPVALPSLGGGLLGAAGAGRGIGNGGGTIAAVNPVVALQDNLNQSSNQQVLTYKTNAVDNSDLYLRIVALDQFNGTEWQPSKRSLTDVPKELPTPKGLGAGVKIQEVTTNIAASSAYQQIWLPLPYPAMKVNVGGHWRFEPEGRTIIGDRGQTTSGAKYSVQSWTVEPTAAQLANAPAPDAKFLAEYTKVPRSLPDVVAKTALQVTQGATNDYEKAVALQRWFTSGLFTYSTSVRSGTGVDAITRFLKDKQGFCVHFAFTMAAMARTLGIPARVAVGFTPGTLQADGAYSVGLKDAHAWPELYFQGVGWTRFEPTPSRGSTPGYTLDQTPASTAPGTDTPSKAGTEAPNVSASPTSSCSPKDQQLGNCDLLTTATAPGPTSTGLSQWNVLGISLLALLLLAVPAVPLLWRLRVRARRLGSGPSAAGNGGPGPDPDPGHPVAPGSPDPGQPHLRASNGARALAAWRELVDTGWDYGVLPDDSETPRRAVARLVLDGGLDETAGQAARRVGHAAEQAMYAPRPQPAVGVADDVRLVREGLRRSTGRTTRLRAVLMPRSAARVVWELSDRWSETTQRWAVALRRALTALRRPSRQT